MGIITSMVMEKNWQECDWACFQVAFCVRDTKLASEMAMMNNFVNAVDKLATNTKIRVCVGQQLISFDSWNLQDTVLLLLRVRPKQPVSWIFHQTVNTIWSSVKSTFHQSALLLVEKNCSKTDWILSFNLSSIRSVRAITCTGNIDCFRKQQKGTIVFCKLLKAIVWDSLGIWIFRGLWSSQNSTCFP